MSPLRTSSVTPREPSALSVVGNREVKRIIDAVGLPVFVVNVGPRQNFRYGAVNIPYWEATGLGQDDIQGRSPQDIFGDEQGAQFCDNYSECVRLGRPLEYEESLLVRGKTTYWQTTLTPIFDHDGTIVRILGTTSPTSEQRRNQEALRYQNLLLTTQQETSPDGILVVDERGRARSWNQRHLEIWQIDDAVMLNPDPRQRLDHLCHAVRDGEAFVQRVLHLYRHLEESEAAVEVTLEDGRILERYTRGLVDDSGRYWGRIWFFRDITARKNMGNALRESEERFQQMASHLHHQVLWMLSPEATRVLYVSPAYDEIWGRPRSELYREPLNWLDAVQEPEASQIRKMLQRRVNRHLDTEFRIRREDGEERWIHLRAFPIRKHDGHAYRLAGIAGVAEDVTARREAEEKAKRHQSDLTHIGRVSLAGEMASGLAHELNQPLAAIVSYAQAGARLARQGCDPTELGETLDKIARQGLRAGEIIHRLRRLVRKSAPEKRAVDLNQLINNVNSLAQVNARRQGVEIRLLLAYRLPLITADSIQIEQVLFNLIQNGIDATADQEEGQRSLTIRTAHLWPHAVEVSVSDTGTGLPEELVGDAVFDPFVTTKATGMGLGLSISRSIVEAHNGVMSARNLPDGGACVKFTLPVVAPD